ncbi:MAG: CHASE3 domain-containing protein, partial [Negativicutes bacterium]|nr:CHASE3 domain-containing protein [Negativicutes bacterium]
MFTNTKVRTKILLGFASILVMMLLSLGITFFNLDRMTSATDYIVEDAIPMQHVTQALFMNLLNEETGVRAFIASNGDENLLGAYNNGRKDIETTQKELEPFLAKHSGMSKIIREEAKPAIDAIHLYFESQIKLVREGKLEEARAKLGGGKALFAKYREANEKIKADIDVITKRDRDGADRAASQARWIIS